MLRINATKQITRNNKTNKNKKMKNLTSEQMRDLFAGYELSVDEMFNVRGGGNTHSEPIMLPPTPPIKI